MQLSPSLRKKKRWDFVEKKISAWRPFLASISNNQTLGIDPLPWCPKHFERPWPKFRPLPPRFLRIQFLDDMDDHWRNGNVNHEQRISIQKCWGTSRTTISTHSNIPAGKVCKYQGIIWDNINLFSHKKEPFQICMCSIWGSVFS